MSVMYRVLCAVSLTGLAFVSPANGGVLIPVVPVAGSVGTIPFGINNKNVITGMWLDSEQTWHGFVGTIDGHYSIFDYSGPGATGTAPDAINDDGWITGNVFSAGYRFGKEFIRKPNGSFVIVQKNGTPLDGYAEAINSRRQFVGTYSLGPYSNSLPFVGKAGAYKSDLGIPLSGATFILPVGINRSGTITGQYTDATSVTHGFVLENGTATQVDYPDPNAASTSLGPVNDSGIAVGDWEDKNYNGHGFIFDTSTKTFTAFNVSHATTVWLRDVNDAGFIALTADSGSFVYCPKRASKCPAAAFANPMAKVDLHRLH
jgi:hypothetical protein